MTLDRAKVVAVIERAQPSVRVAAGLHRNPRHPAFARLVPGIEQERLVEPRHQVRTATRELVIDRNRADDAARAARLRRPQAQQANHIGQIAVVRDFLLEGEPS